MNDLGCKTSENAVANLQNRFLFCNTFLLPVRYLYAQTQSQALLSLE